MARYSEIKKKSWTLWPMYAQQQLCFDSQCSRDDVEGRSRELLSDRGEPTASVA
jgi:hypothetical protein